ncbi:MAG: Trk system potassium transporter TrkA [Calditrichia bacterium]
MNILIIGAGEVGFHLTRRLSAEKHNITLLEANPERVHKIEEQLDAMVLIGSGTSIRDLKRAGIKNTDIFAALTNNDEVNLIACQIAKKLGIPHKIARVRSPELADPNFILSREELGVDLLIHPEKETAESIVKLIRRSSATDVIDFAEGKAQLLGIRLEGNSPIIRRKLKDIWQTMNNLTARVVAINRKERTIIPDGETMLMPGDQLFIIAEKNQIPQLVEVTGKKDVRIENIMILGGGLIGRFVAQTLENELNVKIIESRSERSEEIAEILMKTLVIHGDGTDMDLLALEGIVDMDAFIAVTGDDETNIISTLMARHLRVPRTIALVNKTEYLPITPTIGMDAVVSKKLLTVNAILRFIQKSTLQNIATIPGVEAEIIEITANKDSRICRHPLKKVDFPKSAIIGAVERNDQIIIPTGDTQIMAGDKVIIFTLPREIGKLEKLFN